MSGKILNTVISLGGKVDGTLLKALNKTKNQTQNTAKSMQKAMGEGTKVAAKAMTKSLTSVATGALKIFGAIKAISKLKDFASETVTAAKAQIEVQTKLASVLENVKSIQIRGPNAAADAAKVLSNVADKIEQNGVIGADITMAGMQQLATYQLSEKEISVLSTGMTDLLAQQKGLNASQSDGVAIGNLIGKAMMGNVGALSRVGITFDEAQAKAIKTGDATLRAATIAQVLQENVGGVNKALGETDQGQLLQTQNTFDAIHEEIGYFILPLMNKLFKGILPYATKGLQSLQAASAKFGPVLQGIIDKGFAKLSDILPDVMGTISDILPIITQLKVPMGLFMQILPVILELIRKLSPSVQMLIKSLVPLISNMITMLIPAFETLIPPITDIISTLLPVLISLFNMLAPEITNIIKQFAPLVALLLKALMPAISALIPIVMQVITSILPVVVQLINSVFSLLTKLAPVISVVAQVFVSILGGALNSIIPIIQGIISYFNNVVVTLGSIVDFIVNIFTGNWSAAWQNVQDIFAGVFRGFVGYAKSPLNIVIGLINTAIGGINGLTGIINKIPGVEIGKIPQIPYLAKGATVTSPTLAMIGEGRVPETVVPHNNNPRSRALLSEAARGVGVKEISILPVIDRITEALSYFKMNNKSASISQQNSDNSNNSRVVNYYYQPVVNAKDAKGVKEVLEDEFEKFKAWVKQMNEEERREVFG